MNKNIIRNIMKDALEGEIPSEEVNLWPAVKAEFTASQHPSALQRDTMSITHSHRVRRAAIAFFIAAILLAAAIATPQGRAFAQEVLQFFTRAGSNSFPLQPGPEETPSPDSGRNNVLLLFSSVAKAESAVGFDAMQFAVEPEGYVFRGIEANPALGVLLFQYDAAGGGGGLTFAQSLSGFPSDAWSEVPPNAVEKVNVGGSEGEYAQGMFVVLPGADSATWEPNAPVFRLRWRDGDRWFSLEKMGDTYPTEWLDKQAMIALAESLVEQP